MKLHVHKFVFAAKNLENTKASIGVPVVFMTPDNLSIIVHPDHPLHPAFPYLSGNHQSDYLRVYLWHLYGGGWFDVKPMHHSWRPSWEEFRNPEVWLVGPVEIGEFHIVANATVRKHYKELIVVNQWIGRPHTPLSQMVFEQQQAILTRMMVKLKKGWLLNQRRNRRHRMPQRCCADSEAQRFHGYPLHWTEILGSIYHPACFEHREHLNMNLKMFPMNET